MPKRRPLSTAHGNAMVTPQRRPVNPVNQEMENTQNRMPEPRRKASFEAGDDAFMRQPPSPKVELPKHDGQQEFEKRNARRKSSGPTSPLQAEIPQVMPMRPKITAEQAHYPPKAQSGVISTVNGSLPGSRKTSAGSNLIMEGSQGQPEPVIEQLHYHHQPFAPNHDRRKSNGSNNSPARSRRTSLEPPSVPSHGRLTPMSANMARPSSAYSSVSEGPLRTLSPGTSHGRTPSPSRNSPDTRPLSFVDLLNVPYPQPPPVPTSMDNTALRSSVGGNATLLDTTKTLEMYRANVKKTSDPTIQYEFAVFMVNAAAEALATPNPPHQAENSPTSPQSLLREARQILQKLSDRSYPFAQYYLADGYSSGLFSSSNTPNNNAAFPLFVAASKHGHAEAGYRAALCYEFGWGCRKDPQKAVQFYRQAASKNHPGACTRLGKACLTGDMGLVHKEREGLKWLKRAAESADFQYNAAPYELGILHATGYGDDIFRDEAYAAQLFTQSADLGHVEANFLLGEAYEFGRLSCPRDPALSVHFYTGAANGGHPAGMMALCAWFMVGAEPVLGRDEAEAFEWARRAAETGEF